MEINEEIFPMLRINLSCTANLSCLPVMIHTGLAILRGKYCVSDWKQKSVIWQLLFLIIEFSIR